MQNIVLVFAGGGLGAALRYLITLRLAKVALHYPLGTLVSNLVACFLIGFLMGGIFLAPKLFSLRENLRLFFVIGFLGGFSTLSSFNLEMIALITGGNLHLAVLHFLGNICLTLFCTYLGVLVGSYIIHS